MDIIKKRVKKLAILVWIGQGVLKFLTFLFCGLFVYLILDYFLFLPSIIRLLFLVLVCVTGLSAVLIFKFNSVQELEAYFPKFKGRLFTSISEYSPEADYSKELIEEVRTQTAELLKSINLWQVVKKKLHRILKTFLISTASLGVLMFFLPSSIILTKRFFLPTNKFLSLSVYPGDIKLTYGDSLEIKIVPQGLLPRKVFLYVEAIHELPIPLYPVDEHCFKTILPEVTQDITYYAKLRDVSSTSHKILVQVNPWLKNLKVKYAYPKYTKIPSFESDAPTIEGLYGTRVTIYGESNVHLSSARIKFKGLRGQEFKGSKVQRFKGSKVQRFKGSKVQGGKGAKVSVQVNDEKFEMEFHITQNDSYQICLIGENGLSNKNPEVWSINAWEDEAPQVEILFPATDIKLPVSMRVPIIAHLIDDYGISNAYLVSDKGKWQVAYELPPDTAINYEWDISSLSILPGDIIKYWLEVYDNDIVRGPKRGKSQVYRIYFPKMEDIYEYIAEQEDKSIGKFEKTVKELEERSKELEKLAEKNEFGWNEKQEIKQMLKREKEIERQIKELANNLDELHNILENTMWVDNDLVEKIEELQNLFSELNLPELQEAIRKVEDALHKEPELLAEALKNLTLTQEELRKKLERTIELLKRFKNEQQLKALAEQAKELEEWQARINEQTSKGDSLGMLADEEEALQEELEQLAKDLEELAKKIPSLNKELTEEANKANQTASKLKEANSKLSRGKKPSKLQQEISKDLNALSSNLLSLYSKMIKEGSEKIAQEVRKLEHEFLFLSFEEENISKIGAVRELLLRKLKGEHTGSPLQKTEGKKHMDLSLQKTEGEHMGSFSLEKAFRQEAIIKGTKTGLRKLELLMDITPFISNAAKSHISKSLNLMKGAKHNFEDGLSQKGEKSQKLAMAELNKAISELIKSESAIKSASGTGMPQLMQQLSQLSQQQGGLNQLMQSLLPLNLTPSELMGQLSQLAGKQQALAGELQEIARGLKGKVLGDLGGVAQEMEKIAQDLREGINEKILERQKKVLKHLLDSQKSVYKKKQSRKRISESGKNFENLKSPPLPKLITKKGVSQKDILKALREKYPERYEDLIRAYFRALTTE